MHYLRMLENALIVPLSVCPTIKSSYFPAQSIDFVFKFIFSISNAGVIHIGDLCDARYAFHTKQGEYHGDACLSVYNDLCKHKFRHSLNYTSLLYVMHELAYLTINVGATAKDTTIFCTIYANGYDTHITDCDGKKWAVLKFKNLSFTIRDS